MRGSLWSLGTTTALLPINFIAGIFIARLMGPTSFGELAILITFLSMAAPLTDFGFGMAMLQWSGRAIGAGAQQEADDLFRKALGFHLLVQLPILAGGAMFILRDAPIVILAAFVTMLVAQAFLGGAYVRLVAENRASARAKFSFLSSVTGTAVACYFAYRHASPATLYVARSGGALLPSIPVLWLLSSTARRSLLRPGLPRNLPVGFWKFARGAWLAVALGAIIANRSEIFLLRAYGDEAAVGVFAVVFTLATQITAPIDMIQANLGPALTALSGRNEEALADAVQRSLKTFGFGASLVLSCAGAVVVMFPHLYGREYRTGAVLLPALLVCSLIQTALAPYSALAVVRRRRRLLPMVQAIAVVLDLGLAAALIPPFGATGAAVGACVGLVSVNVLLAVREEGCLRKVLLALVAVPLPEAVAAFAGSLVAAKIAGWTTYSAVLAAGTVGPGVFLLLVRVLRKDFAHRAIADLADLLPVALGRLARRLAQHLLGPSRLSR